MNHDCCVDRKATVWIVDLQQRVKKDPSTPLLRKRSTLCFACEDEEEVMNESSTHSQGACQNVRPWVEGGVSNLRNWCCQLTRTPVGSPTNSTQRVFGFRKYEKRGATNWQPLPCQNSKRRRREDDGAMHKSFLSSDSTLLCKRKEYEQV